MKSTLGLIVAMSSEARALTGRKGWQPIGPQYWQRSSLDDTRDIVTVLAGTGGENAAAAAGRLIRLGATTLVSLGLCGGLSPHVRTGDVILARRCLMWDGRALQGTWDMPVDVARRAGLLLSAGGLHAHFGDLLTTREAVLSVRRKAALHKCCGALAVDMESAAVAGAAAEAGLACLVCRAVCDPAGQAIPSALAAALASNGRLQPEKIGRALWHHPRLARDLAKLTCQSYRAHTFLRAAWRLLLRGGLTVDLTVGSRDRPRNSSG